MTGEKRKRRSYASPVRAAAAEQKRRRIVAAASALFERKGYDKATMREIATAAGVSDRTVYLAFPTKAALLSHCIRAAVRGDDNEAPMLARADWRDVLEASPDRMLALLADAGAQLLSRAAGLLAVGESIGVHDPDLDAARARGRAATHTDSTELAKALKRARLLRHGMRIEDAADIIYAVAASESLYLRLVHHRGWSDEAYARLIERILTATLTQ